MCLFPVTLTSKPERLPHQVSCGKCLECLRQVSTQWAFRILDECSLHADNCFLTLTYNNDNLPADHSVSRREHQLFLKKLRKALAPRKIRFFVSGEYGKLTMRPHYHYIIFNWYPDDAVFFKVDGKGTKLYRSKFLEKIWTKGFSSVGKVTYDTALYCAKYLQKAQFLDDVPQHLVECDGIDFLINIKPPFVLMSNRPGIGYDAVYNHISSLRTDRIYAAGRYTKVPRYYLKVFERDGIYLEVFKIRRQLAGQLKADSVSKDDLEKRRKSAYEFLRVKKYPT